MAVPDFQSLMLPLLQIAGDGQEHALAAVRDTIAAKLKLTPSDLAELLPSGRQSKFVNRVAWAKVYLEQAGLLVSHKRGHFQISDRGREVLGSPPPRIDMKFLEQYPEFRAFRTPKTSAGEGTPSPQQPESETPEETLESAYLKTRVKLSAEILARIKTNSAKFFERLVVELLLKMGYGGSRDDAGQVVGRSGDEGIDGIISEDRLGLDFVYLQAKRWDGTVGRPEIQKFVGALHGRRAKKGVFITTGNFSADAVSYIDRIDPRIVLIDGARLAELMIDFEVGVANARSYHVRRIDHDFFEEE